MCEFTRKGFQDGCKELNVETLEDLKNSIPRMRDELKGISTVYSPYLSPDILIFQNCVSKLIFLDPITGKQIYLFTFNIARLENQKNLGLETAIAFWDLLMSERFEHMDLWKQFLVVCVYSQTINSLGKTWESNQQRHLEFGKLHCII